MQIPVAIAQAAAADPGSGLDSPLRSMMEDGFGVNLHHVRLHSTPESLAANRALRSLAFVVDGHICLRPGFDASLGPIFPCVLAHELAHVMQKERAKTCEQSFAEQDISAVLEAEADEVASQILSGRRVSKITPDPSPEPRCWGPAGHYYTVFLASNMAGLSLEDCKSNAFYAQMPDQVTELDAIPAGTEWVKRLFHRGNTYNTDRMVVDRNVQIGLHALSGWAAESETTYRKKILDRLDPGSFEFGLALHPFGDSYAHRILNGGERMYMAPAGHLVEADVQDATIPHLLTGAHRPDRMELRPKLYREYGLALYDMFIERWKINLSLDTKQQRRRSFEAALDVISSVTSEDSQIGKIGEMKDFDGGLELRILNAYFPEMQDEVPWEQFHLTARLNFQGLGPDLLDRALGCAEDWSRGISF
jgi:Domain of unknown function (DUF4157)